jgi:Mor family transcriptional regulator
MSIEKIERNNQIYQDRLDHMSWRMMSQKYNLNISTLRDIVDHIEAKNIIKDVFNPD